MTRLRTANLLAALSGEVSQALDRGLKAHPNQTTSSAAALNVLGFWEGCSNAELARVLGLSHTATVRLVDKLEAQGLVDSRPGEDRRFVSLHLTPAGREHVKGLLTARCAAVATVTDVLTPAEQDQLGGLLEKLLIGLVTDEFKASHICRLCDEVACPPDNCPVHVALERLGLG